MKKLSAFFCALALVFAGLASPIAPAQAATEHASAATQSVAGMVSRPGRAELLGAPHLVYDVTDVAADGHVRWHEHFHNLVTTVGKTDVLDKYFKGSAYTAGWFLGLKGTGTAAVGDTAASHAGWAEVNPYTGNRPAITFGTSSAGSNTATAVSYSITSSATVAGAFIQSVNTGTTGILYSAGDFTASRSVVSGDTLNVTMTVSFSWLQMPGQGTALAANDNRLIELRRAA
jgi:hypothetical protein